MNASWRLGNETRVPENPGNPPIFNSCEMGVPLTAIHCFTLFYTKQEIISEQSKNKKKQLYTHALSSLLLDIARLYEHNLKHYNNL